MGTVADAVLAGGGRVYGVIPDALMAEEIGHRGITELRVVKCMHECKAAELADAFVALPGGFGTLDELCEIVTGSITFFALGGGGQLDRFAACCL